jgi:hypothetical protein
MDLLNIKHFFCFNYPYNGRYPSLEINCLFIVTYPCIGTCLPGNEDLTVMRSTEPNHLHNLHGTNTLQPPQREGEILP